MLPNCFLYVTDRRTIATTISVCIKNRIAYLVRLNENKTAHYHFECSHRPGSPSRVRWHAQPQLRDLGVTGANHQEICEAGLYMMMLLFLLLKAPLVGFFFTQRVIHAMFVVAYLLFVSIGLWFLATVIVHRYRASAMKDRR